MNRFSRVLVALVLGALAGAGGVWIALDTGGSEDNGGEAEREPLYWVAPMDPDYRRDAPGKSPMGMDLIPVYEEDQPTAEPGAVLISPDVVNNLGVRTEVVERGRLGVEVDTVGYVQYDEDRLVHIHPRVPGWIETLYVKASGDPVTEGAPLYTLYSPTLVNAQEELLLALKRNDPELIRAASDRLAALQLPRESIEALRRSGEVSQSITFHAPQSGVVDNLQAREGMYVEPGMKILSIGVLDHVWVIGEIFERQASAVEAGDPVRLRLDYLPGREWRGQVDYVYPTLNPQTRTARVRVHIDNPDGYLRPGMFAQMEIHPEPGAPAILVPREALIRTESRSRVVLALGDGRFKSVAVQVGRVGDQQVEVLAGLEPGDRIVTSAQFLIDSESSRTSDFRRMYHGHEAAEAAP